MASIRKKGETYHIRVSIGSDYKGNKLFRYKTWKPQQGMSEARIEKELQRIAVEFENSCKNGEIVDDNIRLCDFIDRWFRDYAEVQLREYTIIQYRNLVPRINQALGHIKLRDLRPTHLLQFYNNLREEGIRLDSKYVLTFNLKKWVSDHYETKTAFSKDSKVGLSTIDSLYTGKKVSLQTAEKISAITGKPISKIFKKVSKESTLSGRTVQYYHRLLSSILSTAVEWEAIRSNPCAKVKTPKLTKKESHYLDADGAKQLLKAVENEPAKYRMLTVLLLLTGMRREEAMGLEWKDIDFDHAVINIVRTSQYAQGKGIITDDTKNTSSNRAIKAPASLMKDLEEYRKWQQGMIEKLGDRWEDHDRLFTQWDGKPMNPQTYTRWFKKFVQAKGLPDITPHSLRHTNATLQIANNVPLTTVAGRLGHSTPATTTKIYSHEIKSADAAAAEMLDNLLEPN